MSQNSGEISVKVVSVVPLTAFEGEPFARTPIPDTLLHSRSAIRSTIIQFTEPM